MSERVQDVEGLLERLERPHEYERSGLSALAGEAATTIRALRSEQDEAERMAREWVNQPPENFESLPRKSGVEILCYGLFLYAKGLRNKLQDAHSGWAESDDQLGRAEAALSRKDAALREAFKAGVQHEALCERGETELDADEAFDEWLRALASEPGHEGGGR